MKKDDIKPSNLDGRRVKRNSDGKLGTVKYYWGNNKFLVKYGTTDYITHRNNFTVLKEN